jgi:hypothetical protein
MSQSRWPEQLGMACRTAIGAIPAVKFLGHMQFPRPLPAGVTAAFKAFGNMTSGFHGSRIKHARRQNTGLARSGWSASPATGTNVFEDCPAMIISTLAGIEQNGFWGNGDPRPA